MRSPKLMHLAVMPAAQQNEIVEPCLTAVRPVHHVMPLNVLLLATAWVLAMPIARHQRTAHGRRYHPAFATDAQGVPACFFDDGDQPAIAREPPQGFRMKRRFRRNVVRARGCGFAGFDRIEFDGLFRVSPGQRFRGNGDHKLMSVTWRIRCASPAAPAVPPHRHSWCEHAQARTGFTRQIQGQIPHLMRSRHVRL